MSQDSSYLQLNCDCWLPLERSAQIRPGPPLEVMILAQPAARR